MTSPVNGPTTRATGPRLPTSGRWTAAAERRRRGDRDLQPDPARSGVQRQGWMTNSRTSTAPTTASSSAPTSSCRAARSRWPASRARRRTLTSARWKTPTACGSAIGRRRSATFSRFGRCATEVKIMVSGNFQIFDTPGAGLVHRALLRGEYGGEHRPAGGPSPGDKCHRDSLNVNLLEPNSSSRVLQDARCRFSKIMTIGRYRLTALAEFDNLINIRSTAGEPELRHPGGGTGCVPPQFSADSTSASAFSSGSRSSDGL